MDNYDLESFNANEANGLPSPTEEDKPLRVDLSEAKTPASGISRQPLSLGGASAMSGQTAPARPRPAPEAATAKPAPPKLSYTGPAPGEGGTKEGAFHSEGKQITGVKTFFTKLHHGSVTFMDEQIADWLKSNPDVVIKQTNVSVGDVVAKKTEPNLIVMIWY